MPKTLVQMTAMHDDVINFTKLFKVIGVSPPNGGVVTLFVSMDREAAADPRKVVFAHNGDEEPEGYFHAWSGLDAMRKPMHVFIEGKRND